jgi:predicted short-subunit dehydrogenase-like oxidoreductase (DUF2520 family)
MKRLQVGLVVEGNATASSVLRLSYLIEVLGPVKSAGLQVARRISNFLRAGFGVSDYLELECAQLILLKLPDSEVARVVSELCEVRLPFASMSFVLCETWMTADALMPLKQRGAEVASAVNAGHRDLGCFALEGDKAAVRRMKRLLEQSGAKAIELRPGTKPLYFAADLLSTAVPIPLFQLAQQALRKSGVSGSDIAALENEWFTLLQHRVRKGARATWGGPLADCSEELAAEHFHRILIQNPGLAAALDEWLTLARRGNQQRAKGHSA